MIDTHSHLLPGLDHGCPDMDTCLRMARAAAESGVDTIVCTPHLPEWNASLVARARGVITNARAALDDASIRVRLLLGFEVDLSVAATASTRQLLTLSVEDSGRDGENRVILLEMPYMGWPVFMEDTIFRLAAAGLLPVLAHPERNDRVQDSSDVLRACLRAGAIAQATAGSLSGLFGRASVKTFGRLLGEGLISLLASDAHANREEGWTLGPLLEDLTNELSAEDILVLTETNPRLVLSGRMPSPVRPDSGAPRRGLSRRLKFR